MVATLPDEDGLLSSLNQAQAECVTFPVKGILQVLAGPGTGKTTTLTTRVAYILKHSDIKPGQMMVMTFTKAAAEEMRNRVAAMVGPREKEELRFLKIGTFHSILYKYIKAYGTKFGILNREPTILDDDDVLQIFIQLLQNAQILLALPENLKDKTPNRIARVCKNQISDMKNKGIDTETYLSGESDFLAIVWREYERVKSAMDGVDFDDILLLGKKLFRTHPEIVSNIKTVLIDEFQDSNAIQIDVVCALADACNSLTLVGDPDQSIYGFRGAVPENMKNMLKKYPEMKVKYLEQNYRSTQSILNHANELIGQEVDRLGSDRQLQGAKDPDFATPIILSCETESSERAAVAAHVQNILSTGLFKPQDIAILFRIRRTMKSFESALMNKHIPCFLNNAQGFWDRAEIKTITSYLKAIYNDNDVLAVDRTLNIPPRGIGKKTMEKIAASRNEQSSYLYQLNNWANQVTGSSVGLSKESKLKLREYIAFIRKCRHTLKQQNSVTALISIIDLIEQKWKVSEFHVAQRSSEKLIELDRRTRKSNIEILKDIARGSNPDEESAFFTEEEWPDAPRKDDVLGDFLAANMLDNSSGVAGKNTMHNSVTLSTIHGAKGLEWPVVFTVRCVESEFTMGEENDDVRRLMFVSMTRPKTMSYISWFGISAEGEQHALISFIKQTLASKCASAVYEEFPRLSEQEISAYAKLLKRELQGYQVPAAEGSCSGRIGFRSGSGFISAASLVSTQSSVHSSRSKQKSLTSLKSGKISKKLKAK